MPPETSGGFVMPDPNIALIRQAYAAYDRGDTAAMLDLLDPDLEWTYPGLSAGDPCPRVCHDRGELAAALAKATVSDGRGCEVDLAGRGHPELP
jgi:ketosteroid isomerase-like protein